MKSKKVLKVNSDNFDIFKNIRIFSNPDRKPLTTQCSVQSVSGDSSTIQEMNNKKNTKIHSSDVVHWTTECDPWCLVITADILVMILIYELTPRKPIQQWPTTR